MNYFFITGYPRSRTTWLSNFFTTDKSFCFHELISKTMDGGAFLNEFINKKQSESKIDYLGNSDSGLLIYTDLINKLFYNAKWLIVEREFENAKFSYKKSFKNSTYLGLKLTDSDIDKTWDILKEKYNKIDLIIPQEKFKKINYEDLNKIDKIEEIWNWCVPGIKFNNKRYQLLNSFRINRIIN